MSGLSPRVRGNRSGKRGERFGLGSIPAGAGEPAELAKGERKVVVYPRGCGGTVITLDEARERAGLSPRVRGNQHRGASIRGDGGSIPAGAGEPSTERQAALPARVYPRGCGGTEAMAPAHLLGRGLSPRVRGNPMHFTSDQSSTRSIPAGAGEPSKHRVEPVAVPVYPRGCGGTA